MVHGWGRVTLHLLVDSILYLVFSMEQKITIKSFTDLNAWKESHKLALLVYKITEKYPDKETFGLVSQMRRAAVSISSNIAEGFSRGTVKDKYQFYLVGYGSLTELQNQLLLSRDLKFLTTDAFKEAADQTVVVAKLINGLKRIKNNPPKTYNIRDTKYENERR